MERIRLLWKELPNSKPGSLINFAIRVLLCPAFVFYELACLPARLAGEEFTGYKYSKSTENELAARLKFDAIIFTKRFSECWAESGPLWFQAVLYVIVLDLLAALGIQHLFRNFRAELESFAAAFSGRWYVSYDGHKHALSLTAGDEHYKLPAGHCLGRHCIICPLAGYQKSASNDCLCKASFFAACCKLSYENYSIIEDVTTYRWNLKLLDHQELHANLHLGHDYVPDIKWYAARSCSAVVVCFTGAQIFNKIDRVTDIPTSLTDYHGCGRMADGLVRGLQQSSASKASDSVFEVVASLLEASDVGEIYLTGHSLGGALSVIFANILHSRNAELAAKIKGIFTFGAPRIGDATFADTMLQKFGGRIFRYTHAADMVVKLPHSFQNIPFVNFSSHRFITSFPVPGQGIRVLKEESEPKLLAAIEKHEASFAHINGLAKMIIAAMRVDISRPHGDHHPPMASGQGSTVYGLKHALTWLSLEREKLIKIVERVLLNLIMVLLNLDAAQGQWFNVNVRLMLLAMPGIADHLPGEYQRGLEDSLRIQFQELREVEEQI